MSRNSLGASRRGPQKYVPYRADDLRQGKRTGIAVAYVQHSSDGFEPFEDVMGQADLRTPPKPKLQRKRKQAKTPVVEEDTEEDDRYSPAAYFANARAATSTAQRQVARRSEVRPNGLSVGPSRLARSTVARSREEDIAPPDFDDGNYEEVYDDPRTPQAEYESDPDQTPVPSRKPSLSARSIKSAKSANPPSSVRSYRREEVDTEEEDEVEQHMSVKQSRAKGKQRQVEPEPEPEPEEELPIADYEEEESPEPEYEELPVAEYDDEPQQYDDNPEAEMEVDEEPAPPSPRKHTGKRRKGDDDSLEKAQPKKKARSENDGVEPKKGKGRPRKQDVLTEVIQDQNLDDNGLRRGARMRYKPLDWWRCEKVVYGRRETGKSYVPTIKEIRRLPQEETKPLGGKHRRKRPPRSKSVTVEYDENLVDPEDGWDDETEPTAYVLEYPGGEEVQRRVAFTAKMVDVKAAASADFFFQKVFGDGNFMAAGQLVLPPSGQKPTKSTKDNTFIFYVIQGAVNVRIHRTSFVLSTGGMFLVPRGNMYYIQNITDRDTKLFFAQARRNIEDMVQDNDRDRSPTAVEYN